MICQPFKLITFDITGTLFKYRSCPAVEYSNILKKYGIEVKTSTLEDLINKNWKFMTKKHPNFGLDTGIGWETFWRTYAHNVLSKTFEIENINVNVPMNTVIDDLMMTYSTGETFEVQNGAIELLEYLKKEGIPLGVLSNYDPRIKPIIKNIGLSHYFKFILSSYEVKSEKPDIRIFREAESFVDTCSDRDLFLHVGDSYSLDFIGAKNAGWSACLIHTDKNLIKQYPSLKGCVFDDFIALKMFLTLCNSKHKCSGQSN
ncbi:HAD-like domain,HAD-superfamily hydrolase, subfamily IA, REG-2-like,HAD hydrolase, subfamily IA [Cinara cedri]|uniref:HAD-like domain,HAD-superfamily hydrolase, subfamily IA, REG-2-like,HAD hydrolase, subfamily IA n=1 Tax=Cinara cedri TaxID=506608 RepID=A0A5E4N9H0_9HEMI|nr:HAD-like domain,HAD-superfamily hydrolase, subfamily IA, REG-2-like,HAD hydrolase, subfamily IA [Cinara cedri]